LLPYSKSVNKSPPPAAAASSSSSSYSYSSGISNLILFLPECCGCRSKEAIGVKNTVQESDWYRLPNSK
jgi:hypothetical protein